jgi:putative hydrolase
MPLQHRQRRPRPGQLDYLQYGAERAERNGVPAERIVTTWPLDRLLEWAGKGTAAAGG